MGAKTLNKKDLHKLSASIGRLTADARTVLTDPKLLEGVVACLKKVSSPARADCCCCEITVSVRNTSGNRRPGDLVHGGSHDNSSPTRILAAARPSGAFSRSVTPASMCSA